LWGALRGTGVVKGHERRRETVQQNWDQKPLKTRKDTKGLRRARRGKKARAREKVTASVKGWKSPVAT